MAKVKLSSDLTIADFRHAPAVDQIDHSGCTGRAGETIRIRAGDEFEVAGVEVSITETGGTALERGAVTGCDGVRECATTTALTADRLVLIEVAATDRTGHKTTHTRWQHKYPQ